MHAVPGRQAAPFLSRVLFLFPPPHPTMSPVTRSIVRLVDEMDILFCRCLDVIEN